MSNAASRNQMQRRNTITPKQVETVTANEEVNAETSNTEAKVPTRTYQLANLTFPVTILFFNHVNSTDATHEVVTFNEANELVAYLANTMAASRVVTGQPKELVDVPTQTLLGIFNRTRGESPLDRFRDRKSAETRTAEVVMSLAVPFTETQMAKQEAAATGTTSTEAKAAERKAAREKKAAEKAAAKETAKKEREAKRAGGIIGTIKSFLESKTGGTQAEILDKLVEKFPDRSKDGMMSTVKIQCSRLAKTTGREISAKEIQGRGRVYKFVDAGPIPGKEVVKEAPKPEPAAPKAGTSTTPAAQPAAVETPAAKKRGGGKVAGSIPAK